MKPTDSSLRRKRGAFTLIEVIGFVFLIACMVVGALVFQERMGGRFGWVIGIFVGILAFFTTVFLWCSFMAFAIDGIPKLPKCRDGCCRAGDYKLRQFGEEFGWVCKLGKRYKRRGRRFLVVNEDGSETPYLIWRPFRGWFPDSATE